MLATPKGYEPRAQILNNLFRELKSSVLQWHPLWHLTVPLINSLTTLRSLRLTAPIGMYGKLKLPLYLKFEDYYLMPKAQSQNCCNSMLILTFFCGLL